jgi:splicing factor 1
MQQTVVMQMKLKIVNDRVVSVQADAIARDKNPDRSPSPPPKYDAHGKRTNTTEVWMRESLMDERNALIEQISKLNPLYVPPVDYIKPKPSRMLRIPQKEYPNYNFIGLIIGPRGNTQKKMEMETGTKISIRGKGSVKDGSKGRANKNVDESEELHVHIMGDDESNVRRAAKMIEELLCPVDDDKNEHKQKQLRELVSGVDWHYSCV